MATADRTTSGAGTVWLRTDSLTFLAVLAGLSLVLAHLWTVAVLPSFNSNHLGCDACHHAIMIQCQALADPKEGAFLADSFVNYPQTSHWLAARWMPLVGNDPYLGMRAVSAASVLLLLACQFSLLRRVLPAGTALLGLLSWQLLCYLTNLANVQYYSVAYFFSQGVGMTFVWAALVLSTWPTPSTWQRGILTALGAACAGAAYLCHIVPGAVVLGGLGLYFLVRWLRAPNLDDLTGIVLTGAVGLAVVLGTPQLAQMSQGRHEVATTPLKNWQALWAWVPTLLLALLWVRGRWSSKQQRQPGEELMQVLTSILAVAGLLQSYCIVEYLLGKVSSYSFNKFFYILFPVCTLMWLLAGVLWLRQTGRLDQLLGLRLLNGWTARTTATALVGLLVVLNGRIFFTNELKDEHVDSDHHPVLVSRELAHEVRAERNAVDSPAAPLAANGRSDLIYYDPALPQSSVFVNVIGLGRTWADAYAAVWALQGWAPGQPLPVQLQQVSYRRLVLPPVTGNQRPVVAKR